MPELGSLNEVLAGVRRHLAQRPDNRALTSIIEQLEYLIAYRRGENDGARLRSMNMGIIAVREIEAGDLDLARQIYRIEADIRRGTLAGSGDA